MTVTQTIVEGGPGLGSWELVLVPETPDDVLDQLGFFGHIAIVAGEGIDVVGTGDALLDAARYVGVYRAKGKGDARRMAGSGMVFWLGDEDNKGHVFETELVITNKTMAEAVALAMPPSATVGVVWPQTNPAARYTGKHRYQSPRQVLTAIAQAFGAELRVNGDGSVDVGTQAQLYAATPSVIVNRQPGTDFDLVSVEGTPAVDEASYDLSTRIVLMGQTETGGEFAVGAQGTTSSTYVDLFGNPVKLTRLISESGETTGTVAQRAQLQYNRFNRLTRSLRMTADEYAVEGGALRVGDMAYVYDPDTGIVDPSFEVEFRGDRIWPDIIRVNGLTWPVSRGHTVAFRTGAGVWIDLTRYVTWETGGGELVVGDLPASLNRPSDDPIQLRIDAARATIPDAVAPGVPSGLTLSTYSYLDARGRNATAIHATWTAPTANADSSVPLDLSYYSVQWRRTGLTTWMSTWSNNTDIDLPAAIATGYDVRVAGVDASNNVGAYTSIGTITTAVDTGAPLAPSDPTVTSYYGQLRIAWGGVMADASQPPSDFNRVDVHVSATSGFTPSPSTLVASMSTAGVVYATAPYGSTRYVKLIAYDHTGNASPASGQASGSTVQVADGDIATLNVGKLVAGVMSADVTMSGRFATALTGARVELNSLGLQKFDATNTLLVSITGSTNLLTGIFKTALTGRRIEIGSGASVGNVQFYAPSGEFAEVRSYTGLVSGSSEAIQVRAEPAAGGTYSDAWNGLTVQGNEAVFLASQYMELVFGGAGPASIGETFQIMEATSRGSGSLPVRFDRFQMAAGGLTIMTWRDTSSFSLQDRDVSGNERQRYLCSLTGSKWTFDSLIQDMEFKDNGTTGASQLFRGRNLFNYGFRWEFLSTNTGTSLRMELRDYTDSIWVAITAGAYTNASTRDIKADIRAADRKGLAGRMARAAIRDYLPAVPARPRGRPGAPDVPDDVPRPVAADRRQVGLIADAADIAAGDTPDDIVTRDEDGNPVGIDLYQALVGVLALAQDVDARLALLERGRT